MPDESGLPKSKFEQIVDVFHRHGVEFIVIGGQAETLHGSPRVTYDVDFCYRRGPENYKRVVAALRELAPTLRVANEKEGIPFVLDARTLELGCNFTFHTNVIALDLLGLVEPIGDFDQLLENAERYEFGGVDLIAIGLDDLIRVKEFINRSKDRDSLFQLRAIKQVRAEMEREAGGGAGADASTG